MKIKSALIGAALTAGVAISLCGSAQAAGNIVSNPSFDLDSPPSQTAPQDWTLTPAASGSDFFVGAGPTYGAYSSPNAANFGATGDYDDTLSQVLSTTAGQTYTISFQLAHDSSNAANDFSVTFGGATLLSLVNTDAFDWTLETFTATATSSSTVLAFNGREVPAWYGLDNVNVSAVPEPGTWAMLLAGFGALGLKMGYSRRKAARAAA
jgi:hypothetical protein